MPPCKFRFFFILTTLSVLRLRVIDRMINEYEVVGGMRIGKETEILGENLPQCYLVFFISR
jgi:hypothetical protein